MVQRRARWAGGGPGRGAPAAAVQRAAGRGARGGHLCVGGLRRAPAAQLLAARLACPAEMSLAALGIDQNIYIYLNQD